MAGESVYQPRSKLVDYSTVISQLAPVLFGSGNVSKKDTTTANSRVDQNQLDIVNSLLSSMQANQGGDRFSKEAAIRDTQGVVESIIRRNLENTLPQIRSAQTSAGLMNDTTSSLMENDLQARINRESQATILDTIQKYAQLQQAAAQTAGSVAKETTGSTTQTTQSNAKQSASIDPMTAALGLGGAFLGTQLLGALLPARQSSSGSVTGTAKKKMTPDSVGANLFTGATNQDSGSNPFSDFASNLFSSLGTDFGGADTGNPIVTNSTGKSAGSQGVDFGSAVSSNLVSGAVNTITSLLPNFTSSNISASDTRDFTGASDSGGSVTQGGFNLSVICTALHAQKRLSDREYVTLRTIYSGYLKNSPATVVGYHSWGNAVADYIRLKKPCYRFVGWWFEGLARAVILHNNGAKNLGGHFFYSALVPFCTYLGSRKMAAISMRPDGDINND